MFVFLLGAACTREALRYDFLIAEKVGESWTGSGCWVFHLLPSTNGCLPLAVLPGNPERLGPRTEVVAAGGGGAKTWKRYRFFL